MSENIAFFYFILFYLFFLFFVKKLKIIFKLDIILGFKKELEVSPGVGEKLKSKISKSKGLEPTGDKQKNNNLIINFIKIITNFKFLIEGFLFSNIEEQYKKIAFTLFLKNSLLLLNIVNTALKEKIRKYLKTFICAFPTNFVNSEVDTWL